jgi:threonine synthase
MVLESDGAFTSVSEPEIREARRMVEELEGISPCFSASTALAGVVKLVRKGAFPRDDTVMVNLTGGDRPPAPEHATKVHRLKRAPEGWVPEDPADVVAQAFWK